ncbi:MAG TPA: septum formation family protein [Acidimicrobiales bacterium]
MTWNQTPSGGLAATSVVPCTRPHLIEIVSKTHVPASVTRFPDTQGWINLAQILCAQSVRSYLSYALDPAGRFQINSINPTLAGWLQRDRTMWCGIGLGTPIGAPTVPFTGAVRGQSQELLYPVGTCLNFGGADASSDSVACTQAHAAEVVGNANLASVTQLPQGSTAFAAAVQPQCAALAAQYAGGSLPAGTSWAYLSLAQTSWDAGDRLVQCLIETFGSAGTPSETTGSLER